MNIINYITHELSDGLYFYQYHLPTELIWSDPQFEEVWSLHPREKPTIFIHGREVAIPRWQQAYGGDYHFRGKTSTALPIPDVFDPLLKWAHLEIHPNLNGQETVG